MGAFDDNPTVFASDTGGNGNVKNDIPPTMFAGEMNATSEVVKPSEDVFGGRTVFADDSGVVKPNKESNLTQFAEASNIQESGTNANDVFSRMTLFAEDQSEALSAEFLNSDKPVEIAEAKVEAAAEVVSNDRTVMADQPVINTNQTVAADVISNRTVMADQPVINSNHTVMAQEVYNPGMTEIADMDSGKENDIGRATDVDSNPDIAPVVDEKRSNNSKKAIIAIVAAIAAIAVIGVVVFFILGNNGAKPGGGEDETTLVADSDEDTDESEEAEESETDKEDEDKDSDEAKTDDAVEEEAGEGTNEGKTSEPEYDIDDLQEAIGDEISIGITDPETGEKVEVAPTKKLEDYLNDGWEIISKVPDIIEAGQIISVILGNGDGKEITTEIVNPLDEAIDAVDGIVGSTEIELGDDSVGLSTGSAALDKVTKALEKVDPKMLETGLALAKIDYDVEDDTIKIFTGDDESKYIGINFEDDKIVSVSISTLDAIVEYFD